MGKHPPKPVEPADDHDEDVMEEETPTYTKWDIQDAIVEAFEDHGYIEVIRGKDRPDWYAVVKTMYGPVSQSVVDSLSERPTNATTRGTLMDTTFPNLAGPNDWHNEDDPAFAEAVWKALDSKVWAQTDPGKDKPLQRMVGANTPDLIMCRTKVAVPPSKDIVEAVYITGDRDCLVADFYSDKEKKLLRLVQNIGGNLSMVMTRQPDHADFFNKRFKRSMRLALNKGEAEILPALEAAHGDKDDE